MELTISPTSGRRAHSLHFRSADIASRDLGLRLSDWTLDRYFQPLD